MSRPILVLIVLLANVCQPALSMSISEAKHLPDSASVTLVQKVVTYSETDSFYVEEDSRSIGVRVNRISHGLTVGMRADVVGTMQTDLTGNMERYIDAASTVQSMVPNDRGSIEPVAISNGWVTGNDWFYNENTHSGQRGATGGSGLNNIGLLVKIWGRYDQVDSTTFAVDDGAGVGITFSVPSGLFIHPGWQYVVVTGISTLRKATNGTYVPMVRVRDIEVLLPVESVSAPIMRKGYQNPVVGVAYSYSVSPSACTQGHPIEYRFDWGDGSASSWSLSATSSHAWTQIGSKSITVSARCQAHPGVSTVAPGVSIDVAQAGYASEMIYIPTGSFRMGGVYSSELPQHTVSLDAYWIGEHEVTRGEYRLFMDAGGYANPSFWSGAGWTWKGSRTEPALWPADITWGGHSFTQTDSHPVIGVSYYEAEAFCNWAGGHLATEAQWEMAARWNAATSHPNIFPWGDGWDTEACNNWDDHNPAGGGYQVMQSAPVGSYPTGASPYGCQDMAGNAWEWVQDWYVSYPLSSSPFDYTGTYRIIRGGGIGAGSDHHRCAYRASCVPGEQWASLIGFRLAR